MSREEPAQFGDVTLRDRSFAATVHAAPPPAPASPRRRPGPRPPGPRRRPGPQLPGPEFIERIMTM